MNARPNTETQIRALIWEEARVGGAIGAVSLVFGLLMLGQAYNVYGRAAWGRDEFLSNFATLGVPLIVGLLLILNPDTSGHLVGGFSKRILRLPVQTPIAVAVSLLARTAIVFSVAGISVGIAGLIFENTPGFAAACLITLVYLAAQTLDWVRGPVRGLSSLLVLSGTMFGAVWIWFGAPISKPLREFFDVASSAPSVLPIATAAAVLLAYALCSLAVSADRVGRRYGVPEIWEWPNFVAPSRRRTSTTSFHSPMAAQVWFELRRTKFILPFVAILIAAIVFLATWMENSSQRKATINLNTQGLTGLAAARSAQAANEASYSAARGEALYSTTLWGVFAAVLLASAAQGIQARVIGFRRHSRMSGYEYMQPLTDAQFATARTTAFSLLLLPTLLAAVLAHYGIAGRGFVFDTIPEALRHGITSPREVAWMLVSRGLLVGVLAWSLLCIGTRMFRRILGVLLLTLTMFSLFDGVPISYYFLNDMAPWQLELLSAIVLALFITAVLASAVKAWRRGLVPAQSLITWFGLWMMVAWLFRNAFVSLWVPDPVSLRQQMYAFFTVSGVSAVVPLVYFAVLFDVHRRRSAVRATTDRAQHRIHRVPAWTWRKLALLTPIAAVVLWIVWPAPPAYLEFRRSKGYPATLQDLNDWYVTPPATVHNVATDYAAIAEQQRTLLSAYDAKCDDVEKLLTAPPIKPPRNLFDAGDGVSPWDYVPIVGGGELGRTGLVSRHSWDATEFYWNQVTSSIAPLLKVAAHYDARRARYPLDFRLGFRADTPHLSQLRTLSREAALDTFYWTIKGDAKKATDSLVAGFAIAQSLQREPLIISQLTANAAVGISMNSLERMLNRSTPGEIDLLRIQRGVENLYSPASEGLLLDRAMIGEGAMQLFALVQFAGFADLMQEEPAGNPDPSLRLLLPELVFPIAGARMSFTLAMEQVLASSRLPWDASESEHEYRMWDFSSPLVSILMPSLGRTYESEWRSRMSTQAARVVLAVERYRTRNNKLPDTLNELVPEFLAEVPLDYFAGDQPLKYLVRDNGEYLVYSIGVDMEDDFGEFDKKRGYRYSDITFTVAPVSARTGRQIATHYEATVQESEN